MTVYSARTKQTKAEYTNVDDLLVSKIITVHVVLAFTTLEYKSFLLNFYEMLFRKHISARKLSNV